jgi:hypothetical protein
VKWKQELKRRYPRMKRFDPEQYPYLECSQVQQVLPSLVNHEFLPSVVKLLWLLPNWQTPTKKTKNFDDNTKNLRNETTNLRIL